jgi:hypothetical protein
MKKTTYDNLNFIVLQPQSPFSWSVFEQQKKTEGGWQILFEY